MDGAETRRLEVRPGDDRHRHRTDSTRDGTSAAREIRHAWALPLTEASHPDGRPGDRAISRRDRESRPG